MNEETRNTEKHVWFGHETTAELCAQLNRAGPCRLEVHKVDDKVWLHVIPDHLATASVADRIAAGFRPLNKSHICPPDCP